jgi:hypothetical protein
MARIRWEAKNLPCKHTIASSGASMVSIPSQIAFGGFQTIHHTIPLFNNTIIHHAIPLFNNTINNTLNPSLNAVAVSIAYIIQSSSKFQSNEAKDFSNYKG